MKLIVGLGNPGEKYKGTRHNIGFEILDLFVKKNGDGTFRNKFNGEMAELNLDGEKIIVLKPMTYMNLSGNSVIEAVKFYKIDTINELVLVYDDMDLDCGRIKMKKKGSPGGHNGVKSVISHVGQEFLRIKCGISKPAHRENVVNYVLGKFPKGELDLVEDMKEKACSSLEKFAKGVEAEKLMNEYNTK